MQADAGAITDVIDVEAQPEQDIAVPEDVAGHDVASLHGEGWEGREAKADLSDPAMRSLEQWLGVDAVRSMGSADVEALRRAVSMLPEPEPADSFVWDAIRSPEDVTRVAEAVVGYRQFDIAALVISDAMGANGQFRKAARHARQSADTRIADMVERERKSLVPVYQLVEGADRLSEALEALFGRKEFTVGAAQSVLAAAGAVSIALPMMTAGFVLPRQPHDHELEGLDRLRRRIIAASDSAKAACGVVPLEYSDGVLSGVRRSISERRAGDFVFAVQALGGRVEGRDRLADAGRAFAAYFAARDGFAEAAAALGFGPEHHGALLSHALLRRCLRSGARAAGVDWPSVAGELAARVDLGSEEAAEAMRRFVMPGLSGRLRAACKDLRREISQVREAASRFATRKEYWLAAAARVASAAPGATLANVREVMEAEPQIDRFRNVLRDFGAVTRADVDPLERHLEWMISAYALPVPDEAVDRVVETRAGIIPLRLARQDEAA